ncbi:DUF2637 domain-containing protein [Nocardia cyriacigeorgica]|nr:DUF2637 domain-containing protein [Nocardia cyriacigeorgica]
MGRTRCRRGRQHRRQRHASNPAQRRCSRSRRRRHHRSHCSPPCTACRCTGRCRARATHIVALAMTALIAAGAFWLLFTALRSLAVAAGAPGREVWLWPLIIEGSIAQSTVALLALAHSATAAPGPPDHAQSESDEVPSGVHASVDSSRDATADDPKLERVRTPLDSPARVLADFAALAELLSARDPARRRDPHVVAHALKRHHSDGLSPTQIANELNKSRSTISGILSGPPPHVQRTTHRTVRRPTGGCDRPLRPATSSGCGINRLDTPGTVLDYRRSLRESIIIRRHGRFACRPGGSDRRRLELSALSPNRLGAKCSRRIHRRGLLQFRHRHLLRCRRGLHRFGTCCRHGLDRPYPCHDARAQPGTRALAGVGHPTHDRRPTATDSGILYFDPDGDLYCDGRPGHVLANMGGWAPVLNRSGSGTGRGHAWRRPRPRPLQQTDSPRPAEGTGRLAGRGLLPPMRIGLLARLPSRRHTATSAIQAGAVSIAGLESWRVRQNLTSPVARGRAGVLRIRAWPDRFSFPADHSPTLPNHLYRSLLQCLLPCRPAADSRGRSGRWFACPLSRSTLSRRCEPHARPTVAGVRVSGMSRGVR